MGFYLNNKFLKTTNRTKHKIFSQFVYGQLNVIFTSFMCHNRHSNTRKCKNTLTVPLTTCREKVKELKNE